MHKYPGFYNKLKTGRSKWGSLNNIWPTYKIAPKGWRNFIKDNLITKLFQGGGNESSNSNANNNSNSLLKKCGDGQLVSITNEEHQKNCILELQ